MNIVSLRVVTAALVSASLLALSCSDTADPVGGGGGGGGGTGAEDTLMQITTTGGADPTVSPSGNFVGFEATVGGLTGLGIFDLRDSTINEALIFAKNPDWTPAEDTIAVNLSGLSIYDVTNATTLNYSTSENVQDPDWNPNRYEFVTHGDSVTVDSIAVDTFVDTLGDTTFVDRPIIESLVGMYITDFLNGGMTFIPCSLSDSTTCLGIQPSYSPDAQEIAFEDTEMIMKVNRNGGMADTLVAGFGVVAEPSWSPDGLWVAFVMEDAGTGASSIWVVDSSGMAAGMHRITSGAFIDRNPAWGPDSDRIFFDRIALGAVGRPDIWRVLFDITIAP